MRRTDQCRARRTPRQAGISPLLTGEMPQSESGGESQRRRVSELVADRAEEVAPGAVDDAEDAAALGSLGDEDLEVVGGGAVERQTSGTSLSWLRTLSGKPSRSSTTKQCSAPMAGVGELTASSLPRSTTRACPPTPPRTDASGYPPRRRARCGASGGCGCACGSAAPDIGRSFDAPLAPAARPPGAQPFPKARGGG